MCSGLGGKNAIEIGRQIKEFIATKQQQLPEGIRLGYWDDDTERIRVRLATMKDSAILGFLLVVLILSLFLRPSLAFWVAWGIPIAFAGTFFDFALPGDDLECRYSDGLYHNPGDRGR